MSRILAGVDEAGRGPVLGPMVIAAVSAEEKDIKRLLDIGVTDSKRLSQFKRNELFNEIPKIVKRCEIAKISPKRIDAALLSHVSNLNKLEADTTARLLKKLAFDVCYIDLPGKDARSYTMSIKRVIGKDKNLVAEHKADLNYPIVGAASIMAKVTRDKAIEDIAKGLGKDIGSGYPSDPKTQEYVRACWKEDTTHIRHTWQTIRLIKAQAEQQGLSRYQ